jgi:hypothetical protein
MSLTEAQIVVRPSFPRKRAGWAEQREAQHGMINEDFARWASQAQPNLRPRDSGAPLCYSLNGWNSCLSKFHGAAPMSSILG